MAKRNLARTAIEGGRRKRCREEEYVGTVKERRHEKARLRKCLFDPEYAEEMVLLPRVYFDDWIDLDFNDRLNPVYRWLTSKVGSRWDDVFSEICEKFDRRSLAGRHIVDHISWWVDDNKIVSRPRFFFWPSYWDFIVDDEGILRKGRGWKG